MKRIGWSVEVFLWAVCCLLPLWAVGADGVFNVRDYGATGDGKTLDSPAINKAIEAAVAAGGGTVRLPAGTYLSGSIRLKCNINLLVDAGATILGAPQDMNAYDETEPMKGVVAYQDGGHTFFRNSLIWGENLTNVSITGSGMINGGGLVREAEILNTMCGYQHYWNPVTNSYPPVRIGNKAIALKLCRNVLIRDVTLFHGGHFAILVTGCDNMTIDNVTIDTNRDGMDIDCCRNVMVSNCRVNSPGDDGICLKSTYALGEARLTENLTIANCQVSGFVEGTLLDGTLKPAGGVGRIKFGTESSGGFRNCAIVNCTFRSCRGLALEEVDGGILENITVSNLAMTDVNDYAIYITTGKRNRAPAVKTNSRIRNVMISNVIVDGVHKMCGIQIMGMPEHPVEGIRLNNIRLISRGGGTTNDAMIVPKELANRYPEPRATGTLPAYGVYLRHAREVDLANISVGFVKDDMRPALVCDDVEDLLLDNFKPQTVVGRASARFDKVRGLIIRDSPELK